MPFIMGMRMASIMTIMIMGMKDEIMLVQSLVCAGYTPETVPYWYCWGRKACCAYIFYLLD